MYGRSGDVLAPPHSLKPLLFPDTPEQEGYFLYEWGKVYVQSSEYSVAIRFFNLALTFVPDLLMAHSRRGFCHSRSEMYDLALHDCLQGLAAAHPKHVHIRSILSYNLGIAYQNVNRPEDSLDAYNDAIALAPDMVDAHCNRAITAEDLGLFTETLEDYTRALELDSRDRGILLWRGEMFRDISWHNKAIDDVAAALALNSAFVYRDIPSFRAFSMRKPLGKPRVPAGISGSLVSAILDAGVASPTSYPDLWESYALPLRALYTPVAAHDRAFALATIRASIPMGGTPVDADLFAHLSTAIMLEPIVPLLIAMAETMTSLLTEHAEVFEPTYTYAEIKASRTLEGTVGRLGVAWAAKRDAADPADLLLDPCALCNDPQCTAPGPKSVYSILLDATSGHWRLFPGKYVHRWVSVAVTVLTDTLRDRAELSAPTGFCSTCGVTEHKTFECMTCAYCGEIHPPPILTPPSPSGELTPVDLSSLALPPALAETARFACPAAVALLEASYPETARQFVAGNALEVDLAMHDAWSLSAKRISLWSLVVALLHIPGAFCSREALEAVVTVLVDELRSGDVTRRYLGTLVLQRLLCRVANPNLSTQTGFMEALITQSFHNSLTAPTFDSLVGLVAESIAIYRSVDGLPGGGEGEGFRALDLLATI